MKIKFEEIQEMYIFLGRIERCVHQLNVCMDACEEEKNVDDGLLSRADWNEILDSIYPTSPKLKRFDYANVDEIYNIGKYAKKILSYVSKVCDKDMMLECCKVDRDVLHKLKSLIEKKRVLTSLLKCEECLLKIHNMALEKIWGIDSEEIEKGDYFINVYGKCYRMDGAKEILVPKPL